MIQIGNSTEYKEPIIRSYHGRLLRNYEFGFDQYSRLPNWFEITIQPFKQRENFIVFNDTDTVKLIHGIIDASNKETCKMMIRNFKHRLNEIENDQSSQKTPIRS